MISKKQFLFLIFIAIIVGGCQSAEPETVEVPVTVEVTRVVEVEVQTPVESEMPAEPAVVPGLTTDILNYSSEINGRDYTVYISLPLSYGMLDQLYPVLYVTDGDFYTIPVAMTASQLAFGMEMPEVIVVGIGYGGSAMDSLERRESDLSAVGSESFLQFLTDELIPDIEANYEADPSGRALAGHSLGGMFSIYAMLNAPGTFDRIIASSPTCGEPCLDWERAHAEDHEALPARLFVSVGSLDEGTLPGVESFNSAIEASAYIGLTSEMAILDGESHLSARPRAFTTGLKWVYAG